MRTPGNSPPILKNRTPTRVRYERELVRRARTRGAECLAERVARIRERHENGGTADAAVIAARVHIAEQRQRAEQLQREARELRALAHDGRCPKR